MVGGHRYLRRAAGRHPEAFEATILQSLFPLQVTEQNIAEFPGQLKKVFADDRFGGDHLGAFQVEHAPVDAIEFAHALK